MLRQLILPLAVAVAAHGAAISISNTGLVAEGAADPNWGVFTPTVAPVAAPPPGVIGDIDFGNLTSLGAFVTVTDGFPIGPWSANDGTSKWIQPVSGTLDGQAANTYFIYQTMFTLDPSLSPASAVLNFRAAVDNDIFAIRLNGNIVGPGTIVGADISAATLHSIVSGFQTGVNTLQFVTFNSGGGANPAGFRAEISGTVDPVPEPSTILLIGAGLAGLGALRRRI